MNRGRVNDFRDLIVWQRAMSLTRCIYLLGDRLPFRERGRLADQMRRAVTSIGANIVEGNARRYRQEYVRYLKTAYASTKELEHHLLTAEYTGMLHREQVADALSMCAEISRMLNTMIRRLSASTSP